MTREQKIKMLQDVQARKKAIADIFPQDLSKLPLYFVDHDKVTERHTGQTFTHAEFEAMQAGKEEASIITFK